MQREGCASGFVFCSLAELAESMIGGHVALLDILETRFLLGPRTAANGPRLLPGYVPAASGVPPWLSESIPVLWGPLLGVHELRAGESEDAFAITRNGFVLQRPTGLLWVPFAEMSAHGHPPKTVPAGERSIFPLVLRDGTNVPFVFATPRETFAFMAFVRALLASVLAGNRPGDEHEGGCSSV